MKGSLENKRRRSKSIVWNTDEDRLNRPGLMKEVEEGRRKAVQKNGRLKFEVKYNRKEGKPLVNGLKRKKELEVSRSVPRNSEWTSISFDQTDENPVELKKSRQKERDLVLSTLKRMASKKGSRQDGKGTPSVSIKEWKEQVVRVGTGYRVRKDEKDPRKRRFDVGYADIKPYKRKEGREAVVETTNMGRTVIGKGENARVKVMNAVCAMEKRRPASEYTGSGILRKSRVGKLKLKPTKPSGKE